MMSQLKSADAGATTLATSLAFPMISLQVSPHLARPQEASLPASDSASLGEAPAKSATASNLLVDLSTLGLPLPVAC